MLLDHHGDDASTQAVWRAEGSLEECDIDGTIVWRYILALSASEGLH
jgi:hypothetical protein